MNLWTVPIDFELARLLFDEPRAFAQFVFVDGNGRGRRAQQGRGREFVAGFPCFSFAPGSRFRPGAAGRRVATTGWIRDGGVPTFCSRCVDALGFLGDDRLLFECLFFLRFRLLRSPGTFGFPFGPAFGQAETNWKRGFRNRATHANENVVEKQGNQETRDQNDNCAGSIERSFELIRDQSVPMRPPAGMCPRTSGNRGESAKVAHSVRIMKIIPASRTPRLRTGREASQQNA